MMVPAQTRPRSLLLDYGPVSAVFLIVLLITRPDYFGDTYGYVQSVLKFDRGGFAPSENPLWDFGHLYWRPLGWLFFKLFGGLTTYAHTGEQNLAVTAVYVCLSIIAAFVSVIFTQSIALRVSGRRWIATLVTTAFLCFYAFLDYDRTGNAYVVGLMFLILSLWFTIRSVDHGATGWRGAVVPGIMAGCAVLIWFPYILALSGLLAVVFWFREDARKPLALALGIVVFAGLATALGYSVAILQLHITSVGALIAWAKSSSHGWSQTHRWLRMATGLPRSFLSMRDDGMMLKRYFVRDPYAHVSLVQLILGHLWKLAAFYGFVAALAFALWRGGGRRILAILIAASGPVLLFAMFIFESGSSERYMPIYPFLCIAMAYALGLPAAPKFAKGVIASFALLLPVLNLTMLSSWVIWAGTRPVSARALSLHGKVTSQGVVALTTLDDPLYQFSLSFPFDPVNRKQVLPVYDVIEIANDRVLTWKREFAERALKAMEQKDSVWISKRFLSPTPDPGWRWTEGDDRRISWKDLPVVFQLFNYSEDTGGADGFVKLEPSRHNVDLLDRFRTSTDASK